MPKTPLTAPVLHWRKIIKQIYFRICFEDCGTTSYAKCKMKSTPEPKQILKLCGKLRWWGAVTPASVLTEAIAPVTTPTQETDSETHRRAWHRVSPTNDVTSTVTYLTIQKLFQYRAAGRNKLCSVLFPLKRLSSPISRTEGV